MGGAREREGLLDPRGTQHWAWLSGYWWRWSRHSLSEAERQERDAAWVALYGEEAYAQALRATEWVLQLPHPPPSHAPAGSWGALAARAAAGEPELWEAHTARAVPEAALRRERMHSSFQPALPMSQPRR